MRLTAVGRKTGTTRSAILDDEEDGQHRVKMAMNGWGRRHDDQLRVE